MRLQPNNFKIKRCGMPNKDLEGIVAIVTGAGSGIGTGISKILHNL